METEMVMEAEPNTNTAVLANNKEEVQPSENPPQSTAAEEMIIASSDCPSKETARPTTENKREREDQDADTDAPELETKDSGQKKPHWKTSLCSYFRGRQGCSHGDSCCYAHGEAELRPRLNNSWDPTSDRAKKLQKTTTTNGSQAQKQEEEEAAAAEENTIDASSLDKCLLGLPKNWASGNLKKFLDAQGILYKSAKKKKRMAVGFVVFESVEQVKDAIEVLNEKSAGGKQIKIANATRKSHEKHTFETTESHPGNKVHNGDTDAADSGTSITEGLVPKTRIARDVVTPLAHMPYSDQLEHKKNSLLRALKRLPKNARKACPDGVPLPEWILKCREIGGLPCKFEGILESPVIDGYRNKCEFSVGYSLQGKRTVGFTLGNFREGVTAVEEPINCPNVSRISCEYALIFQEFLQSSVFPVWNRIDNTGFWRQFTVREGRNPGQAAAHNLETPIAEVMLIIQVCSQDVDEEQMKNEFKRMAQALAQGASSCSPPLPLTTMVVQDHKGISNAAPADCPLLPLPIPNVEGHSTPEKSCVSEARIHDYLSNLRFSLSPTAFFQVNTLAAERLYSLAGDWAELSPDTLLFDICCGTGTIGLTLAHRVGMVVGVEMNESAVSDAHRNAQINGIKNCNFVCGKAEDVIGALLKEYLGVPQQKVDASDVSGSNDVNKDASGSCDTKNEKLLADVRATMDTHTTNASAEGETLLCEQSESFGVSKHLDRESTIDFNKEDGSSDSLADESSSLETSDTNNSRTSLKSSTTECRPTSKENEDCRDTDQDILKDSDTNKENDESRTTGEDGYVSEEKGIKTARVCQFKDIVAIVDPPRVGLHPTVIRALRTHPRIRRLVYVSCNPESLVANAIELCTPTTSDKLEKGKGNLWWKNMSSAGLARHRTKSMPVSEPFRPVKAVAVDLFPHTPHCEMVMLLER